jgi:hypothetical protein
MDLMTLHPDHAGKYGDSGLQMFWSGITKQ